MMDPVVLNRCHEYGDRESACLRSAGKLFQAGCPNWAEEVKPRTVRKSVCSEWLR